MKKVIIISIVIIGVMVFLFKNTTNDETTLNSTSQETNPVLVVSDSTVNTTEEQISKSKQITKIIKKSKSFASDLDQLLQIKLDTESFLDFLMDHEEELDDPIILDLLVRSADRFDDELLIEILDLIVEYEHPEVLDFARQAFESKDAEVRVAVMDALDYSELQDIAQLIIQGLHDKNEEVREAALYAVMDKEAVVVMEVVSESLKSDNIRGRADILDVLDDFPNHQSLELLFNELNSKNQDYKEAVNEKVFFFIGEEFESSEQALNWWASNKNNYDAALEEVD